jgi:hypothetical protein
MTSIQRITPRRWYEGHWNLRPQCLHIRFADAAQDNLTACIDQKTLGQSEDPAERFAQLCVSHQDRIRNIMFRDEAFDGGLIIVHRYADHL